jgi:hypothetical protein
MSMFSAAYPRYYDYAYYYGFRPTVAVGDA